MDLIPDNYIQSVFKAKGLKCTPQRIAVFKVIEESKTHLSIEKIHEEVKKVLSNVGLATVYRTLDSLIDLGLIEKVHLEDGCHNFTSALSGHRHAVVCKVCDQIVEYEDCPLDGIKDQVSEKTGFEIDSHYLQLFGTCRQCQAQDNNT
ncbi:MAG: transcriptional repressor [Candidatus Dadabacteria bacterium]|nr:transcriptional repressor [Candidatus Dadabacteria bacterium]NIS09769.1 transcriptional repressor [Candidatus Dadabacteria bacterium]NIY22537.1 transcriptional repressor [Candidatus Dadabacteria bacterium]